MIVIQISRGYSDSEYDDSISVFMFTQKETLDNPEKLKECLYQIRGSFLFDLDQEDSENRFKERFENLNVNLSTLRK